MTFSQDIIAVIWDFDKTLIPTYMQLPLFQAYNIDEKKFWNEVSSLQELYKTEGITINPDTIYLNHLLSYVQAGLMPGLNNEKLRSFGKSLEFFPGIPQIFQRMKNFVHEDPYRKYDIRLENYIVSTGLSQVIKGSLVGPLVEGIWGCEFIEIPYLPNLPGPVQRHSVSAPLISSIAYTIDNTTKTRAVFEINKGVNLFPEQVSVNQRMKESDRRVPFENMLYIADGPSDIPAFSVVKKGGGNTLAVYSPNNKESFRQAKNLLEDDRVDMLAEADYQEGTTTDLWIFEVLKTKADRIVEAKKRKMEEGRGGIPRHLN